MMIHSAARVGPNFEVRGEYQLLDSTNGAYQAGVVFGHPDFTDRQWLSLRLKWNDREGEVAGVARHFYVPRAAVKVPLGRRGRFRLRCSAGHVGAEVNGMTVQTDYVAPDGLAALPDALVGLGAYQDSNVYSVRYRRVELRRLGSGAQ
jgi:hypothetical protein